MALRIVDPVDAELSCVLWLIAPDELNVAGSTPVALFVFEGRNVLHTQVVPQALCSINVLVWLELVANVFPYCGIVVRWWGWTICIWRRTTPHSLVEVMHLGDSQVTQVAPLEVIVYDPYLLWVVDGEALAAVHRHSVAESPVVAPLAFKDLLRDPHRHFNDFIQHKLLLVGLAVA